MKSDLILLVAAGLLAALFQISVARASNDAPLVIRNVRIFDGERVIEASAVTVANGKISAIGSNLSIPHGAQVIDGTGDTLLPGLIDAHVHLWKRDELKQALIFGNTTVLDMFMWWQSANQWKQDESRGDTDIADFRTAGFCFATPGGHGNENPSADTTITKPGEAQVLVDDRIAHGSDYIKVMYDNGPRFATMPKDVMESIVTAAHKRGKMVIAHASSPQGIYDVINAGVDGLAHVPIVRMAAPEFRDALKGHHIFAITTLTFTDFHLTPGRLATKLPDDPLVAPYLGPESLRALSQPAWHNSDTEHLSYADNETNLLMLRNEGVPLLAGTDASDTDPPGALLHAELELMVKAGIPPPEVLADTTSVPARIFSITDRGRIAPGLRADLLLVRGDPTKDIRKTRDIVAIWKQGVRVDRELSREKVAERNVAWSFGTGWMPVATDPSTVHVHTLAGGPERPRATMLLKVIFAEANDGVHHFWMHGFTVSIPQDDSTFGFFFQLLPHLDSPLKRDNLSIACEISVASAPEQELKNVQKCLAAGFQHVAVITAEKKAIGKLREFISSHLDPEHAERVQILLPEDFFSFLEKLETPANERTVRGYRVKIKYRPGEEAENKMRSQAIAETIGQALRRFKGKGKG